MKKIQSSIVLGIDLGTTRMGFGILQSNDPPRVIQQGIVPVSGSAPFSVQLDEIYRYVQSLLDTHNPNIIAFEDVFFVKNKKTALDIASVRGVILLVAAHSKVEIVRYTPLQVKQAVTGWGRADKKQVQSMVQTILKLPEAPKPDDVSDALAVALCCLHSHQSLIEHQ